MSPLQSIAIATGLICLLVMVVRLQRAANDYINYSLLLPTSVFLIALGLYPELSTLPAEVLNLGDLRGGRLLALAVLSILALWLLLLYVLKRVAGLDAELQNLRLGLAVDLFMREHNPTLDEPSSLLLVVPALNEAENLKSVLPRIPSSIDEIRIIPLVVNDGSSDDTEQIARRHGCWVANHPTPYGGGTAVRIGYRIAKRMGFKYLATMDADGQHRPEELHRLLAPIVDGDADLVIGSRQLGSGETYSMIRSIGVKLFSLALTLLMHKKLTDCASGFRAMRVAQLARLPIHARQYHTAETIILALKYGLKIAEVPITIQRRHSGKSKKGSDTLYAVSFLRSIVIAWWR